MYAFIYICIACADIPDPFTCMQYQRALKTKVYGKPNKFKIGLFLKGRSKI